VSFPVIIKQPDTRINPFYYPSYYPPSNDTIEHSIASGGFSRSDYSTSIYFIKQKDNTSNSTQLQHAIQQNSNINNTKSNIALLHVIIILLFIYGKDREGKQAGK